MSEIEYFVEFFDSKGEARFVLFSTDGLHHNVDECSAGTPDELVTFVDVRWLAQTQGRPNTRSVDSDIPPMWANMRDDDFEGELALDGLSFEGMCGVDSVRETKQEYARDELDW